MKEEISIGEMPPRPVTLLIAALGGDGGGTLADWIVGAAGECDFPVQSTSVPGVSQRTGATTYYLEIFPFPVARLGGRTPVMALTQLAGAVDIVAASELIEAGRALQGACLDAARSTLVASTHRVYTVAEKVVPGDGRADGEKVLAAVRANVRHAILFDMAQLAREQSSVINAVLFGALAASGALPLPRSACEQAIRNAGKGAEASLRGFAAGFDRVAGVPLTAAAVTRPGSSPAKVDRVRLKFPKETFAVLDAGVARLIDYQDADYAELYLNRLEPVLALDREAGGAANGYRLTCEAGRHLALWMSFEDLIRVADLKTRSSRLARVRKEIGAAPEDLVIVTEYLKPGLDEICSILPPAAAQRLRRWAEKRGKDKPLSIAMHLKTTTISGFLLLRAVSWLRRWRRSTSRYQAEQVLIERWLGAIRRLGFAVQDIALALEIVECARLVQGYGETHANGVRQFGKIFDTVIESGRETDPGKLSDAIRRARNAALANPDVVQVQQKSMSADPGKPIFWMPRAGAVKSSCQSADGKNQVTVPASR